MPPVVVSLINLKGGVGKTHGQRVSTSLKRQDFREELRVHHAPGHLAAKAILDRVTLQEGHREAPQPAQIVAQSAFSYAAVILAEVHVQHPVHRLDAPMAADGLAETFAAEVTA